MGLAMQRFWLVIGVMTAMAAIGLAQAPPLIGEAPGLVATLNKEAAPWIDRAEAEARLASCDDARVLEYVWRCLEQPVAFVQAVELRDGRFVEAQEHHLVHPLAIIALVPGAGSAEGDRGSPVGAQIAYARLRVWDSVTRSAGTAAERSGVLLALLNREQGDFAKINVLRACMKNWSDPTGAAVESIALDAGEGCRVRSEATRLLMVRKVESFPRLVEAVWLERHTPCADELSKRLTQTRTGMDPMYDPKVMLLRIDAFDRLRQQGRVTAAGAIAMELNNYGRLGFNQAGSLMVPEGSEAWYGRLADELDAWVARNRARLETEAAGMIGHEGAA